MHKYKLDGATTVEQTKERLILRDMYTGDAVAITREAWNQLTSTPENNGIIHPGPIWDPAPADQPPEELPH